MSGLWADTGQAEEFSERTGRELETSFCYSSEHLTQCNSRAAPGHSQSVEHLYLPSSVEPGIRFSSVFFVVPVVSSS